MVPVFVVNYGIPQNDPVSNFWNAFVESLKKYTWLRYFPKNQKIEDLERRIHQLELEREVLSCQAAELRQKCGDLESQHTKLRLALGEVQSYAESKLARYLPNVPQF